MLFFYLIEDNASPVQLVSFFFSFFHFVVVYKSILRAREECCCSNRRAQRMLECLGQVVRLSFFFFFSLSIVSFSTFLDCERFIQRQLLYVRYCFALGDSVPFFYPLLEFHFSKFTVKAIGAPSSKSVVRHSLGCFQRPTETVESAQCRCLFLFSFFFFLRDNAMLSLLCSRMSRSSGIGKGARRWDRSLNNSSKLMLFSFFFSSLLTYTQCCVTRF